MAINTQTMLHSPEKMNEICTRLNDLGRPKKEWLDVRGNFPIARQKSHSLLSRFWKPEQLRLVPAFNKTVDFLRENKQTLMDPKYLEKNIETLKHLNSHFSTKKNPNLHLWSLQLLTQELLQKREQVAKEVAEVILTDGQKEYDLMIENAGKEKDLAEKQSVTNKKVAQDEYDKESAVNDIILKTAKKVIEEQPKKLQQIKESTNRLSSVRSLTMKNPILHDVTLTIKGNAVTTHLLFLRSALSLSSFVSHLPLYVSGITLDIFKEFSEKCVTKFCDRLYLCTKEKDTELKSSFEFFRLLHHDSVFIPTSEKQAQLTELTEIINSNNSLQQLVSLYNEILIYFPSASFDCVSQLKETVQARIKTLLKTAHFTEKFQVCYRLLEQKASKEMLQWATQFIPKSDGKRVTKYIDKYSLSLFTKHLDHAKEIPHWEWLTHMILARQDDKQSQKIAFEYLQKLTDDEFAIEEVIQCYRDGRGVDKDQVKACEIYFDLFKKHPTSDVIGNLLDWYFDSCEDLSDFIVLFEKTWQNSYDIGSLCLARVRVAACYIYGKGCAKNIEKAKALLQDMIGNNNCKFGDVKDLAMLTLKNI